MWRMALDDYEGVPVVGGWFLYGGTVRTRVEIIARDYDVWHRTLEADGLLEADDVPVQPGPDGRLYYLHGNTLPHPTLDEARAWVDSQPWAPVCWDDR